MNQYSLARQSEIIEVKNFGKIHSGAVTSMECNSHYLFTADHKGRVKRWYNNGSSKLVRDYGDLMKGSVDSISIVANESRIFISDTNGK